MGEPILYELEISTLYVTVRGMSPLLTHAFSKATQEGVENTQQGGAKRGKMAKDPAADMEGGIYRLADGRPGIPAIAFKKAIVRGAKLCDFAMTDARTSFHVAGDLLPIRGSAPTMHTARVLVGQKTLDIRYRPMFEEWEVDLVIRHNVRVISAEQIMNMIEVAGFGVGVGDWRPECNGQFGMFEVKRD